MRSIFYFFVTALIPVLLLITFSGIPVQIYKGNITQLTKKIAHKKPVPSGEICTVEKLSSRRLIISFEDDFNIKWLIFRLFKLSSNYIPNITLSNYDDLIALHKSLPCGVGGIHLTPSILFTESDLKKIRRDIINDLTVSLSTKDGTITLKPIIAIDYPFEAGWNNLVASHKFGSCCYTLLEQAGINAIWGPTLDNIPSEKGLQDTFNQKNLEKVPRKTIFFSKHFGLENIESNVKSKTVDTHLDQITAERSLESLRSEWKKLSSFTADIHSPRGIMISHVTVKNLYDQPLTFSDIPASMGVHAPRIYTVSDSLDMINSWESKLPNLNLNKSTSDFILWVNFYSGSEFFKNFKIEGTRDFKIMNLFFDLDLIEKKLT